MNEPDYWVFTDGSCAIKGAETGAWAACVVSRTRFVKLLFGSASPTTITRCELIPIIEALRFIRKQVRASTGAGTKVRVYSDSEYTVTLLSQQVTSKKNTDLYAAFQDVCGAMKLEFIHRSRNSHFYMELCDSLCSMLRRDTIAAVASRLGTVEPEVPLVAMPEYTKDPMTELNKE